MVAAVPLPAARRIALAAQGFGRASGEGEASVAGGRSISALLTRLEVLQIDSVNVFERSHYLPVLARLGPYDRDALERLTFARRPSFVESWAHVASFIPLASWPLLGFRRRAVAELEREPDSFSATHAGVLERLRGELADRGPLTAGEAEQVGARRAGPWWGWSEVKRGLETLFRTGEVVPAGRRRFERRYALADRVIPAALLEAHVPREDAVAELVARAARALGIGTTGDIADYFRLPVADTARVLADLADAGTLERVTVDGWTSASRPATAWLHAEARRPRAIRDSALLSPFDPMVWERSRAARLFGLHYRIEIYTPAERRVFGYYSLPVLIDDRVVARLDLKNDRAAGVLRVRAAWAEPAAEPGGLVRAASDPMPLDDDVVTRIAVLLAGTAAWQGGERVDVEPLGTLAPALRAAVASLGAA